MMWKIVFTALAAVVAVGLGGFVGGFQDVNVTDEGARNALNFAVVQHNKGSNDLYISQVSSVLKVQRQVVSGFKYVIKASMAKTACRKDSANEVCAIHQDPLKARPYQCTFTVWTQPWLDKIRVLNEKC